MTWLWAIVLSLADEKEGHCGNLQGVGTSLQGATARQFPLLPCGSIVLEKARVFFMLMSLNF